MKHSYAGLIWLLLLSMVASPLPGLTAPPPPQATARALAYLAADLPPDLVVHSVQVTEDVATVCLEAPPASLAADAGMGAELAVEAVRRALTPLAWRELSVQAVDPATGLCRPVSDFLPDAFPTTDHGLQTMNNELRITTYGSGALSGKTVYLSAGHGWQWGRDYSADYPARWSTQRGIYQGIIEDHNNAEVVDQYLIPYLENAGATVIPVRERDWNAARVIADNDAGAPTYTESGAWATGEVTGYVGGTYRLATTVADTATATATWVLAAPQQGTYALYAWVRPYTDRAPDAHYTIQHAGGVAEVFLDQAGDPETWRYLGTFPAYVGPLTVTLDNRSAAPGLSVMADALRLGGGVFDALTGIDTLAATPPNKPWWESSTRYYAQWVGLNPDDWSYFNDIVGRPIFARWHQLTGAADAVFISWHTNGYNGTARGTESYVHNSETVPRTEGSLALQQAVHDELINDIRAGWDAAWTDRGKKSANLGEVRMLWDSTAAARVPGVLLEVAFHDQVDDTNALKDPRFAQLTARAVYQGIVHYFETRDGVALLELPEPPTHLHVQNVGGGAVRVAWSPAPTDTIGLTGDAATGYRLYTSPDGFAWGAPVAVSGTNYTLTGLTPGAEVYAYVTSVNAGGESLPTEVLGARVGDPTLLIVNGFDKLAYTQLPWDDDPLVGSSRRLWLTHINRRAYVVHHGQAAPALYAWDSASNEAVSAGLVALGDYPMVDWILGEEANEVDGTLNAAERAALAAVVAEDGALLISGSELAWDLVDQGRDPDFLRQVLRTDYVGDDAETYSVMPTSAGALVGLPTFYFDASGEYDADSPDVLTPYSGGGGTVALTYATGGAAAVQYEAGCARLLVWGFPFESVRPESRPAVMAAALDFLDVCAATLNTVITTPQPGGYYSVTPEFAGTAAGAGLTRVEVQVQRGDGAFWDGAAWGVATWLTTTGTLAWTYPLPLLSDAAYTLTARAVAEQPDDTPAQIAFVFDATPPLSPTQLIPQGTFSLVLSGLHWIAPPDTGSPLIYQVELDDQLYVATATQLDVMLRKGTHFWRVRAIDAAGNVGAWSAWAAVVIEYEGQEIYLPLVLRAYTVPQSACDLTLDSGFETADGWGYNALAVRTGEIVHSGSYAARVGIPPGSPGQSVYSSISQTLWLPASAATITLNFWAYPIAEELTDDYHYVTLWDGEGEAHTLSTHTSDARAWELRSFDLSDYAGQRVQLFIGARNDGDEATAALYVDDVQVESCP